MCIKVFTPIFSKITETYANLVSGHMDDAKSRFYIYAGAMMGIVICSLLYISIFVISAIQDRIIAIRKMVIILPLYYLKTKGKEIDSVLNMLT